MPPIAGWHMTRWLGDKVIGKTGENVDSALRVVDSRRLGRYRQINDLPAEVRVIEKDIKDINEGKHDDKPKLIAINALRWYGAVREYHRGVLGSGKKTSQDYVNQLLAIMDEAGVSHDELVGALSDTWVESPISRELMAGMKSTKPGPVPTSS